jgi:hypothetical protein
MPAISQVDPAAMRQALHTIFAAETVITGQRLKAEGIVAGMQWSGPAGGATMNLGAEWNLRTGDIIRQLGIIRDKLTVTLANYTANDQTQQARAVSIASGIGSIINA